MALRSEYDIRLRNAILSYLIIRKCAEFVNVTLNKLFSVQTTSIVDSVLHDDLGKELLETRILGV